jgi:hypothetical protein
MISAGQAHLLRGPFGPAFLAFCSIAIHAFSYYTTSKPWLFNSPGGLASVRNSPIFGLFKVSPKNELGYCKGVERNPISPPIGITDCCHIAAAIDELQRKWQRKIPSLTQQGREPWVRSVHFAIEIARNRIEEVCADSPMELSVLLDKWEQLSKRVKGGTESESIRGIDFGIRLVVQHVRRCLNRLPQRKPPTSANGNHASLGHKSRKRGSQF